MTSEEKGEETIRVVLMHRRTSKAVEVQRAFEAAGMTVYPVVAPDEFVSACRRLRPHAAIIRASDMGHGMGLLRWARTQEPTAALPTALLGPFDARPHPEPQGGFLAHLDERQPLADVAELFAQIVPRTLVPGPEMAPPRPKERPGSMIARLTDEGKQGLLVVSDDDGSTTVVSVGPEIRGLGEAPVEPDVGFLEDGGTTQLEFIETGEQQRLGLVDLREETTTEVPALPRNLRALVVQHDSQSTAALISVLHELGVAAMSLAPGPGWLEHAVDHWPDVIVSDAQPRGPRGFDFLREQSLDPVLSWVPTLLVAAPASSEGTRRNMATRVLGAEVYQALAPKNELERSIGRAGAQKGQIDRYGLPRLLRTVSELRRDGVIGIVDGWNTILFLILEGRLVAARQQGAQGGKSAGPGALARALLTRTGSFTVGPPDKTIASNLSGDLDVLISGARAMIRSLSSERGQGPGRALGCDEGMLHRRLEESNEREAVLIESLIMGGDPRRAAQSVGFRPEEARSLLEDLFRFGAIGIVRHLDGDPRPSSDEAVSGLARFAAGVPEELRPLFELEETEVSSYHPDELGLNVAPDDDFRPDEADVEAEVSASGIDLPHPVFSSGSNPEGLEIAFSANGDDDDVAVPSLDASLEAIEREALEEDGDDEQPTVQLNGYSGEGDSNPISPQAVRDERTSETVAEVPAGKRTGPSAAFAPLGLPSFFEDASSEALTQAEELEGIEQLMADGAAPLVPEEGPGDRQGDSSSPWPSDEPDEPAVVALPVVPAGDDYSSMEEDLEETTTQQPVPSARVSPTAATLPVETNGSPAMVSSAPAGPVAAVPGNDPNQSAVAGHLPDVPFHPPRPVDTYSPPSRGSSLRVVVIVLALVLAVFGGILAGLSFLRCRGQNAAQQVSETQDGSGSPDAAAANATVAPAVAPDGGGEATVSPQGDASSDGSGRAADAGNADSSVDAAAPGDADGGAASRDGDVSAHDASNSAAGDSGVASSEHPPLKQYGPALKIPSSEDAKRTVARREIQRGMRSLKRRSYDRAAWHFDRATTLIPRSPAGLVGLGEALAHIGHKAHAIEVLDKAVEISRGHYLLVRAGNSCLEAGDTKCARRAFKKALRRKGSRAAYNGLARLRKAEREERRRRRRSRAKSKR